MKGSKGESYYGIRLDNSKLKTDARESSRIFRNIGDSAVADSARIDKAFNNISGIIAKVGGTLALGSIAKDLYSFSSEFERSMLEVSTISDIITGDLDSYKNKIVELTKTIPISANEGAKALYGIVSAGHDAEYGMHILEVASKSAIGGMTDTATAADAITTLINSYKKSADEAENISDQLFITAKLGKTTFGEMGRSIAQVAPIAASYGVEMDQVLAAVATLTKSGTPTAQAMTQIRASIVGVSKVLGDGAFETRTYQEALAEVAKMAGGSESKLRELIPEIEAVNGVLGLTGINALAAASDLEAMTNSAGATEEAFNKMLKDSDTQLKLLKNNIFAEFSAMGQEMLDAAGSLASALNKAFDSGSMHEAINMLKVLIATYGTYKAILIATAAVQKASVVMGNVQAWLQLAKSIRSAKDAQIVFNLATKANPYILLASVIIGVVSAFVLFHKNANRAAVASAELSANIQQEKKELDGLFDKLNQAKTGTVDRKKAIEQINGKYGSYLDNLLTEKSTVEEIAEAYKDAKKSVIEFEIEKSRNQYLSMPADNLNEATKDFYLALGDWTKKLDNDSQRGKFKGYIDQLVESVKGGDYFSISKVEAAFRAAQSKGNYNTVDEWLNAYRSGREEYGGDLLDKMGGLNYGNLERSGKSLEVYVSSMRKAEEEFEEFSKSYLSVTQPEPGKTGTSNNETVVATLSEQIEEANEKVRKLKGELTDLRSGKTVSNDYAKSITEKETELKAAQAKLDTLTGKMSGLDQKRYDAQKELNQEILNNDLALQNERLSILKDSRVKQLEQIDIETRQRLAKIDDDEKKLIQKYNEVGKGELPQDDKDKFNERRSLAEQEANSKRFQVEYDYNVEIEKMYEELTGVFLSEEEKKRKAIQQRYDDMRLLAREEFNNEVAAIQVTKSGSDKDEALKKAMSRKNQKLEWIDEAQEQEVLSGLIERYKTYSERRLEIEKKFNSDKTLLENASGDYNGEIEELERQRKTELEALDMEIANRETEFTIWSDKIVNLGLQQLVSALNSARIALDGNTDLSDKEKAVLRAKIGILEKEVEKKQEQDYSATSAEKSKKKWDKTLKVMNEVQSTVNNIVNSFDGLDDVTKVALTSATNIAGGVIAMITGIQALAVTGAEAIKGVERASVILAVVGAAVQVMTSLFSLSSKAEKEHREALAKIQEEKLTMQREYNALIREQNTLLAEAETIFGTKSISAGIGLIKQYQEAIAEMKAELKGDAPEKTMFEKLSNDALGTYQKRIEDYNKGIGALSDVKIKTGSYTTGSWFWKKQHDVMTSVLSVYPDLIDSENNLNKERLQAIINTHEMSDSDKELLNTLLDLTEEAEDALQTLRDNLSETWGDLGDDLVGAVVNAVENGEDPIDAFCNSISQKFKALGQNLMYEMFFADMFKKLEDDMVNTYKTSTNPAEIVDKQMALVDDFFNNVTGKMDDAQNFYQNFLDKMNQAGYSPETEREASARGIATASQESVDENNGRLTVIQSHTFSLMESVRILVSMASQAIKHLSGIENNTNKLHAIESDISDVKDSVAGVKEGIDTINLKGIKLK